MKKAIFLDRDGVINEDFGYVYKIENFKFRAEIFEFLQNFKDYEIFIITNQSGINRGFYSLKDFEILNNFMIKEFEKNKIFIKKVYFCPHIKEENCQCRKPRPGMILQALKEFDLDKNNSILIGDKISDIEAGINAKIKNLFLLCDNLSQISKENLDKINKENLNFKIIKNLMQIKEKI